MQLLLVDDNETTWMLEDHIPSDRAALLLRRAEVLNAGIEEAMRRADAGDETARALLGHAPLQQIASAMGFQSSAAEVLPLSTAS
ncbi:hypothetical protein [Pelagibius sp.]|uniref:hypothetical protein n=1 Tax=Pelagibius sp. TaxID=1931238 RepID=UPI003BAE45FB